MQDQAHPSWLVRTLSWLWFTPQRARLRRRLTRTVLEHVGGSPLVVMPDVLNPVIFRTGRYFAEFLGSAAVQDLAGPLRDDGSGQPTALDVGTGSGVLALSAAKRGFLVCGVDVSAEAVRCARINVALNRLDDHVTILEGDLFAPVDGRRFDLVIAHLPFFRGRPTTRFELAWRSDDVIERFTTGLPAALAPGGQALILLTSQGDQEAMIDGVRAQGLTMEPIARRHFGVEIVTIYRARHPA